MPRAISEKLRRACYNILSPTERQRLADVAQRHAMGSRYSQVLFTRTLCRRVLSWAYGGLAPADWQLGYSHTGQPVIGNALAAVRPPPAFSLSHTPGMVVCAVCHQGCVGVDVEVMRYRAAVLRLAQRFFAPDEMAHLQTLAKGPQQADFMALWTLKEAYLKARGWGMTHLSPKIAFRLQRDGSACFLGRRSGADGFVYARTHMLAGGFYLGLVLRCRTRLQPRWVMHHGWPHALSSLV